MAALRAALLDCATVERMKALGETLYEAALEGDWTAAKLLLAYAIGKAPEAVDPDRLDLDEWRILDAAPTLAQVFRAFMDGCPPGETAELYRKLLPHAKDRINEKLQQNPESMTPAVMNERKARVGK
jgi:hypothetical protein